MASSGPPDIGSAQAGTAAGENAQPLDAQPLDAQLVAMADHSSGIRGNVLNTKTRLWSEVANRFNQQGIDAAVMIPKFLLLMVAFTFVMMITGTLDAVLEELEYDSLDSFLLAWLLLYFKSILLKNQQSNIPELGYLTGPNEQDSETLQGLDQDWVWSKKTYTFFEELGGGDPELDENKERLRTIMELEPGSIIKISSADNQYTIPYWVATHHKSKRILCVIRGTSSFTDKLIDAQAQTIVIKRTVGAHCAMYHVAESIVGQVTDDILGFAKDNSDYTLHFCGHSLGAGVCGLASYLVHESIGSGAKLATFAESVTGTCIAAPPVLTMNAASTMPYVKSLRNQIDVVPTASIVNMIGLVKAVQHVFDDATEATIPEDVVQDYKKMENWIKEAVDRIKQENVPQAKGVLIDLQADSVPEEYKVGKWGIWPMYAPGVLYQVKDAHKPTDVRVRTAAASEERWRTIVLHDDMFVDHTSGPIRGIRFPPPQDEAAA